MNALVIRILMFLLISLFAWSPAVAQEQCEQRISFLKSRLEIAKRHSREFRNENFRHNLSKIASDYLQRRNGPYKTEGERIWLDNELAQYPIFVALRTDLAQSRYRGYYQSPRGSANYNKAFSLLKQRAKKFGIDLRNEAENRKRDAMVLAEDIRNLERNCVTTTVEEGNNERTSSESGWCWATYKSLPPDGRFLVFRASNEKKNNPGVYPVYIATLNPRKGGYDAAKIKSDVINKRAPGWRAFNKFNLVKDSVNLDSVCEYLRTSCRFEKIGNRGNVRSPVLEKSCRY